MTDSKVSKNWNQIPLVTVVIPTRNESKDIGKTLNRCLELDFKEIEIVVVDDSDDDTPAIVQEYESFGVKLIHRSQNENGCCGARNLGAREAKGEIVVFLNGDARPDPDFLDRIIVHYLAGADYVIVRSKVLNLDSAFGRFVESTEPRGSRVDPEWSEGFSFRRDAGYAVGLIPGDFKIPFCRDHLIGRALNNSGYRKVVDLSISMNHVVPGTICEYWGNQVWRGSFSAPHAWYIRRINIVGVLFREVGKLGRRILKYILVLPALILALRYSLRSHKGLRDFPLMLGVGIIQDLATSVGNYYGFVRLLKTEKRSLRDLKDREESAET